MRLRSDHPHLRRLRLAVHVHLDDLQPEPPLGQGSLGPTGFDPDHSAGEIADGDPQPEAVDDQVFGGSAHMAQPIASEVVETDAATSWLVELNWKSIGGYAPVYIGEEIQDNRFQIAGGPPGLEVSWQVTGIRQDPWAEANRIPVEVDKPAHERGTYLYPELYGQPEELGLDYQRHQGWEKPAAPEGLTLDALPE